MQIAGFGFNLFAEEYPSPEAGGGGAQDGFLIIWGIVYKALGAEAGPEGDSDPQRVPSLSPQFFHNDTHEKYIVPGPG